MEKTTQRLTWNAWVDQTNRGAELVSFLDGLESGRAIRWYDNGQKACEGEMVNGTEQGWWVFWAPDGSTVAVQQFERGAQVTGLRRAA